MTTKMVDSRGRLVLGNRFAGHMVIIDDRDPNKIVITPALAIPAREAWLYQNKAALGSVRRGLAQAKDGQFSEEPPDIADDAALAAEIEG